MSIIRALMFGGVIAAAASIMPVATAQADSSFVIGPGGVRVSIDRDRDRDYRYRRCHNRVYSDWNHGRRVKVVDRICYNRYGRAYIADRNYYYSDRRYDRRYDNWRY